jgi:hypothetical protein
VLAKNGEKPVSISLLIVFLIFLIATYYLFYGGPDNLSTRSIKELWNLGHIAYFAIVAWLLAKIKSVKKIPLPYLWAVFLLITVLLGILIEILQYGTDRTPDLGDISRDLTGCLLVLAFHPALLKSSNKVVLLFVRLLAIAVLLIHLKPLAIALIDESTARSQFPILSNFETAFELGRWDGTASKVIVKPGPTNDSYLLKIGLMPTTYSGVGMKYLPSDWTGYKLVNISIFKPSDKPLSITIRIHDAWHETGANAYAHSDRLNRRLNLIQGWNDIKIPLSHIESAPNKRKMDLSKISSISLFATRLSEARVIYLDKVYLSN